MTEVWGWEKVVKRDDTSWRAGLGDQEAQDPDGSTDGLRSSLLALPPSVTLGSVLRESPQCMWLLPQGTLERRETKAHQDGLEEWAPREKKVPSQPFRLCTQGRGEKLGEGREGSPAPV